MNDYLKDNGIIGAKYQQRIPNNQLLDFYIQQTNTEGKPIRLAIECQGIQHYQPVDAYGGETKYKRRQELDKQKYNYCLNNGIPLEYIRYDEDTTNRITEIVTKYSLSSQQAPKVN